ncbi:uncharacterized protein LOC122566446 isoform X2 [Bombus pyrosoma]|uniref:uncharacterized protein LOC122566446 isoform X2 n=1 Tax=Bombus pyrosoma TaxID=396416 RepID=UPI001CB9A882|nr:uncharacterized protein LOC122566446 isoform X2 [Bombus pyrosoma]
MVRKRVVERSSITLPKPGTSDRSTTYVCTYMLIDRLYNSMATYNGAPACTQENTPRYNNWEENISIGLTVIYRSTHTIHLLEQT